MPSSDENTDPQLGDPPSRQISLRGITSSVSTARQHVRRILGTGHPSVDDAALVASELVTNAVLHSRSGQGGTVRLTVSDTGRVVRVEVTDDGSLFSAPYLRDEPCAEGGRGLHIVSALCKQWGAYTTPTGRVIWCELAR
ncbi:ATP-binding protein [Thermopolyspora sp. NPDC052614]|uniref:ATP-binding protein n=1 Tax=Thermopolyspora sp. NPDC052614 TaxID=3155682 RepID=UPI0034279B5F